MMSIRLWVCLLLLVVVLPLKAQPQAEEISWDALIPEDFNPESLFEKYDLEQMDDNDPRADEFMRELKAIWSVAPVVESLAGKRVKIPGFVVPLETRGDEVSEFFLVPYFGACIHVPPPPANQMIRVTLPAASGLAADALYQAVWVIGSLKIERTSNELGVAGYTIENGLVQDYEEE